MPGALLIDIAAATALIAICVKLARRFRSPYANLPYPPGPPKKLFLDNLLDLPKDLVTLKYTEWSHQYESDIIHASAFGTHMIIISDVNMALELMEKRSSTYSDRPWLTMSSELVGHASWPIGFMPYGTTWRSARRLFHQHLHPRAAERFRPIAAAVVSRMLRGIISDPHAHVAHIRFMATELVLTAGYGIAPKSEHDDFIKLIDSANESFDAAQPGTYLVDTLPFLKYIPSWLPGAGFRRQAKIWRKLLERAYTLPYERAKQAVHNGGAPDSIVGMTLSSAGPSGLSEYEEYILKAVTGVMYQAGADTTASTLETFILAMVLNPAVQKRAQDEIDIVIGTERLPESDDEPSLPYVKAVIREVMRWNPVIPGCIPHRLTEDDEFNGYYLPKGSIIIPNIWAMSRDSRVYRGDVEAFDPTRFLTSSGDIDPKIRDSTYVFGFGRRICAGRYLASDALFLGIARMLASMTFSRAEGDLEGPIPEFSEGFFRIPKPFNLSVHPRSTAAARSVLEDATSTS